jgi:hypothetical protein
VARPQGNDGDELRQSRTICEREGTTDLDGEGTTDLDWEGTTGLDRHYLVLKVIKPEGNDGDEVR